MIQINGLTKEQVEMLDFMWNDLDSEEDFEVWYESLDGRQQKMAELLMRMLIIESQEDEEEFGEMVEANNILKKFRK
jgi:hypothetical protein